MSWSTQERKRVENGTENGGYGLVAVVAPLGQSVRIWAEN